MKDRERESGLTCHKKPRQNRFKPIRDLLAMGILMPLNRKKNVFGFCKTVFGCTSFHTRLRNAHVLRALLRDLLPENVLEIGFGEGNLLWHLSRRFPDHCFFGIEADAEKKKNMQAASLEAGNIILHSPDLLDRDNKTSFGLVYCVDVLEHIADDQGFLKKISALMAPGGRLIIHVPKRRSLQKRYFRKFKEHFDPGHLREEYLLEELKNLAINAGLLPVNYSETFGPFGELGFEINSLGWPNKKLDRLIRLLSIHFLFPLALLDLLVKNTWGNSILFEARKGVE